MTGNISDMVLPRSGRLGLALAERERLAKRGLDLRLQIEALADEWRRLIAIAEAPPGAVPWDARMESQDAMKALPGKADILRNELDQIGRDLGRLNSVVSDMQENLRTAVHNLELCQHPPAWAAESDKERAKAIDRAKQVIRSLTDRDAPPLQPEPKIEIIEDAASKDFFPKLVGVQATRQPGHNRR